MFLWMWEGRHAHKRTKRDMKNHDKPLDVLKQLEYNYNILRINGVLEELQQICRERAD